MQRTLFFIPHSLFDIPIFGVGWALGLLVIGVVTWLALLARQPGRSLAAELRQSGPVWLLAAAIVTFVLPMVELRSISGEPLGIAVRGYGVFLLLGVSSGIGLAVLRASRAGIDTDHIFALALWMFFGGLFGARLFYIIEYRDSFLTGSLGSTFGKMLDFTRGGLVVYGSIIGGTLATIAFALQRRIPVFKLSDVIIPSLFLGIFFGRIGCLMNGCCYGGACEPAPYAMEFPPGSPVYLDQIDSGQLLGLTLQANDPTKTTANGLDNDIPQRLRVVAVATDSLAAQRGIKVGDRVSPPRLVKPPAGELDPLTSLDDTSRMGVMLTVAGQPQIWTAEELPSAANPVLPSQLISSLSGLTICLILLAMSKWLPLRTGALAASGFALYAVARFGEEMLRSDEPGQFGTHLSISQWVSLLVLPAAIAVIIYIYRVAPHSREAESAATPGTGLGN